jgi:hypothetical protein
MIKRAALDFHTPQFDFAHRLRAFRARVAHRWSSTNLICYGCMTVAFSRVRIHRRTCKPTLARRSGVYPLTLVPVESVITPTALLPGSTVAHKAAALEKSQSLLLGLLPAALVLFRKKPAGRRNLSGRFQLCGRRLSECRERTDRDECNKSRGIGENTKHNSELRRHWR